MKGDRLTLGLLIGFVSLLGWSKEAIAQLIPDQTLGSNASIVSPFSATIDRIDGGAIRGINLFHSFREFNIGTGRSAYFVLQDAALKNVFARVTGSNRSEILGTLGVSGGNANLFLINPNGILFGPNSSLDVGGSFAVTTANAIEFGDRGSFNATNPANPSPLLTVDPSAFLFTAIDRQAEILNRSAAQRTTPLRGRPFLGLQVLNGQSLLFLGGNVKIDGGILQAPGGRVELGGLAEVGRVGLAVNGSELRLQFPEAVERSDVSLTNSPLNLSAIIVAAADGGSISITARNLDILGGNLLRAGIQPGLGTATSQAGDIILNTTGAIRFEGLGSVFNNVRANATGNAGNIIIKADSLRISDGAQLSSSTFGQGNAGNVLITVRDSVTFDGVGRNGGSSVAGSQVGDGAVGKGGTLSISAASLNVINGAVLNSNTYGQGNAGDISISVRDVATFSGVGKNGGSSGAGSQVGDGAVGKGGNLRLSAGSLRITDGAVLNSSTFGKGDAGNIWVDVRDITTFDGVGKNGSSSGPGSTVETNAIGRGGTLTLSTGTLNVTNGAQLNFSTFGRGDAGNISITVRDVASFDGVSGNGSSSGAASTVNPNAIGDGGTLTLSARSLTVTNGAALSSGTAGRGNAGNVVITVRDAAVFNGTGSNGFSSFAGSRVESIAVGNGGNLILNAGTLNVTNGATLSSSTFGKGGAGNVSITVSDTAIFDGIGSNGFPSRAGSQVNLNAVGKGGTLTLKALTLKVINGAILSSSTSGQGDAGDISITVRDIATFDGVGSNGLPSGAGSTVNSSALGKGGTLTINAGILNVTNDARLSSSSFGQGDAGDISLRIRDTLQVADGSIATSSLFTAGGSIDIFAKDVRLSNSNILTFVFSGAETGGNITLSANSIIALNDSNILAFARDGRGGDIILNTRAFFGQNYRPAPRGTDPSTLIGNDRVDINASGTISGIITLPDVSFIQNGLNQLPKSAIDTEKLVSQTCIVRQNRPSGTFYIIGKTNLPQRPGDRIPSNYSTQETQTQTANKPWQKGDPIVEPTGFYKLANGRLVMSRECDR